MLPRYTDEIANLLFPLRVVVVEEEVVTLANKWHITQLRRCCKNTTNMTQNQFNNLCQYAVDNNNLELEKEVLGHRIVEYVRNLDNAEWRDFYRQFSNFNINRDVAVVA